MVGSDEILDEQHGDQVAEQQTNKRESESDDQTGNEMNMIAPWESRNPLRGASQMITARSDDESVQDELPTQSSTVSSANLKLVYDVEYIAPE